MEGDIIFIAGQVKNGPKLMALIKVGKVSGRNKEVEGSSGVSPTRYTDKRKNYLITSPLRLIILSLGHK